MTPRLSGKRVMIVDDEPMIALLLGSALEDEGCLLVGPFTGVAAARDAAHNETLDFALLDVNVADGKVYPIAETLEARGIPFMLLSGYGDGDVPAGREHWPTAAKPFSIEPMIGRICAALGVAC
ncbi:MAG: response regulator [Acidiphilium sp.]|nr:response regulator [Acidiphilium sp.]MDD4936376.1 response regulator [Acidiphilium sp.]